MILVGIDIGKNKHTFSIINKSSGEILLSPSDFSNNLEGFLFLIQKLNNYTKSELLIGMEDTGHYHFALLKYLLDRRYTVALINPTTTDLTRKLQGGITKNDPLDSLTICDVISSNHRNKPYRVTKLNRFDLYEQKQLTRHHHNLKEELNTYKNRLQKCIDIVFPEFNSLFHSKYGIVYMNILKIFSSAKAIANADIRSIRKCFEFKGKGKRIFLSAEQLKLTAKSSIGIPSVAEEIQIRHLVSQIELLKKQISEIDKRIEEVFPQKQLSYPHHTGNITFFRYFYYIRIRRDLQLYKGISNHQICRCCSISLRIQSIYGTAYSHYKERL